MAEDPNPPYTGRVDFNSTKAQTVTPKQAAVLLKKHGQPSTERDQQIGDLMARGVAQGRKR